MDEMTWGFHLGAKGGQNAKENKKTGAVTVKNKSPEFALKVKIKNVDETVDGAIQDIIEKVGGIAEVTLTFDGTESQLQADLKKIAAIIAAQGGQQTLEMHMGDKKEKVTA